MSEHLEFNIPSRLGEAERKRERERERERGDEKRDDRGIEL